MTEWNKSIKLRHDATNFQSSPLFAEMAENCNLARKETAHAKTRLRHTFKAQYSSVSIAEKKMGNADTLFTVKK